MPKAFVNGIEMNYVVEGEGPPLVLLHGLGSSLESWRPHIPFFAEKRRVIAADTRGHGGSSKPEGPYTIGLFAGDWHALLDALQVEKAVLLGLSMGGAIAMQMTLIRPGRTRALVLVDTWAEHDPEFVGSMEGRIALAEKEGMRAYAEAATRSVFSDGYRRTNPEAVHAYVEARVNLPVEPIVAATRACIAFDVLDRLPQIQAPALVLVGSEDALTPPRFSRAIAERLPNAVYREVPGCGHILPLEKPEEFRAAVAEFLRQMASS